MLNDDAERRIRRLNEQIAEIDALRLRLEVLRSIVASGAASPEQIAEGEALVVRVNGLRARDRTLQ